MRHATGLVLGAILFATQTGCSIKTMAVNMIGDALASGGSTFASDDDPELVKTAVPFSLKLMESLLAESPRHKGLLVATAGGFTQYSYGFVQQEADEVEDEDLDAAFTMRERAKRLYLRARDYGLRGLEVNHRGFQAALRKDPDAAVGVAKSGDVPLLYWTAASWAAAISLAKDDTNLMADLPVVQAMIDRALVLNESFEHGAIHSFLITYEMSSSRYPDAADRARNHFERAMELNGGQQAAPLVALAEAVALAEHDRAEFEDLLDRALAINADAAPEWRLANLIYQRRARWLLQRIEGWFLPAVPSE